MNILRRSSRSLLQARTTPISPLRRQNSSSSSVPPIDSGSPPSDCVHRMEITRANFEEKLPMVLDAIRRADVIAFDCEFTGLAAAPWLRASWMDSVDSKWMRLRDAARKLSLLQYGLTTFEWDGAAGGWIARPLAFNVLPRKSAYGGDDSFAGCGGDSFFAGSSDTVTFLRENHFDFNAWAEDGVSFLSAHHEAKLRDVRRREVMARFAAALEPEPEAGAGAGAGTGAGSGEGEGSTRVKKPMKVICKPMQPVTAPAPAGEAPAAVAVLAAAFAPASTDAATVPNAEPVELPYNEFFVTRPDDIKRFEELRKIVEAWRERITAWTAEGGSAAAASAHGLTLESFDGPAGALHFPFFVTEPIPGFSRRVVHTHVEFEYGSGTARRVQVSSRPGDQMEGGDSWSKRMRLTWVGEGTAGRESYLRSDLRRDIDDVDAGLAAAAGCRKIFDAITAARVPVVGHNCWMDLAHTTAKFLTPELDRNIVRWAGQVGSMFPLVYDTKYLLSSGSDPVVSAAFSSRSALGKAFAVVEGKGKVSATIPPPPPPPAAVVEPAAGAGAGAEGAPETAAAPAAAKQAVGPRKGGRNGPRGEEAKKMDVDVDWTAYAPITIAKGFGYKTAAGPPQSLEDAPIAVPAPAPDGDVEMTGGEPATPAVEPAAVDHGVAHDAGYDSYMTGVVFLRVAGRLLAATAAQAAAAEAHFAAEGAAGDAGAESVHRLDRNRAALAAITATPLPSTTLHDVLRMVMSAPAPGAAAEVGVQTGPPMQALLVSSARAVGNVLNNMQAFDRIAACIKLDELRALDRAGRAKDTAPAAGELGAPGQPDAGEGALLVARARARDKACWLHICGLDYSV